MAGGAWCAQTQTLTRYLPNWPGRGAPAEQPEAIPSPDPAPLESAGGSPPTDELLELLYRSGEPKVLSATARQWLDFAAIARQTSEEMRAGGGGFASLLDTVTSVVNVTRTEARLRVSGPDRYRLDYSARPRPVDATTISCDGERCWRVFQDHTLARPLRYGSRSCPWPSHPGCSASGYPAARSSPTGVGPPTSSA